MLATSAQALADDPGTFLDPGARLFTLNWPPDDERKVLRPGGLVALTDGSVAMVTDASGPNVMRLGLDGRLTRILGVGRVGALAVEPTGALLSVVGGSRVYRSTAAGAERTLVVDLGQQPGFGDPSNGPAISAVAALDTGDIVVSDRYHVWLVRPNSALSVSRFRARSPTSISSCRWPADGF